MLYVSTRGEAPTLGFADAMLAGLARDGGLYVPAAWPRLDADAIAAFAGRPYAEVAVEIIRPFVGDAIPEGDLARMTREAYGRFRHPAVAPLVQFGMSDFILELFHGPTLAFKDLAMQLLGHLMDEVLTTRGERTTIVVATSGDTGGAAIEAFRGRKRTDLFVLFPRGRISDVQRRMMTTVDDDNVHALAIEGTFDDCQSIVKGMFGHQAFRDQVRLSGVNSINWARIVAQVVYYFTAAVVLGSPHRKVAFTVPTGNFGDIYAGYVALRMGLPVDRLTVATNVNDILARTITTGTYELRDVVPTSSPSMDIQVASNFEPHTAVGVAVAEKEIRDPSIPIVVLGTAHPAKFPDAVEAASGMRPALPDWLADLNRRPERATTLPLDQVAVERHILSVSRAAHEGAAA